MDVRLPAPAARAPGAAKVAVPVGTVLLVAPLAAIATQGLHPLDRLDALMVALAGLVILAWGGYRLAGPRPRLHRDTDLRLDDAGVTVRGADTNAMLAWPDLSLVEVGWWEIVPPYVEEATHLPVLRFVPHHDGDIALNGVGPLTAELAHAFGSSPAAAALTVVLGPRGARPLQQVLDWLADRGDVLIEVGDPPDL